MGVAAAAAGHADRGVRRRPRNRGKCASHLRAARPSTVSTLVPSSARQPAVTTLVPSSSRQLTHPNWSGDTLRLSTRTAVACRSACGASDVQLRISLARRGPISLERVELLSVSAAQPCVVTLRILPPGITQARPCHDHCSLRAAWPSHSVPRHACNARAERFRVAFGRSGTRFLRRALSNARCGTTRRTRRRKAHRLRRRRR